MRSKAIGTLLALFFSLFSISNVLAQTPAAPDKPSDIMAKLAWFVPAGVVKETKPVLQFQEYVRNLEADRKCFQGDQNSFGVFIPGSDSAAVHTDVLSTSATGKAPAMATIILDHYVLQPDGNYVVTTLCGKKTISSNDVKLVVEQFVEQTKRARDYNFKVLGRLAEKSVKILEQKLGKEGKDAKDFEKNLDLVIPGYEADHITYREYYYLLQNLKPSDFVPRELHLGYNVRIQGILGVTWLETGRVYYNPQAWTADVLTGLPKVLAHEFVHASPLQRFPLADVFDVEMEASMPEMLATQDQIDLFFHGYTAPLRKPIKVFFGLNYVQARKEMVKWDDGTGNWVIDEVAWNKYMGEQDRIKAVLLKFCEDVLLPEFYSDPWFWASMNYRWNDKNAYIYILMAREFHPTLLGGPKKTEEYIEQNSEMIAEIGKESWDSTKEKSSTMVMSDVAIPPVWLNLYRQLVPADKQRELEAYYTKHPAELRELAMHPEKVLQFMKSLDTKTLEGGVQ